MFGGGGFGGGGDGGANMFAGGGFMPSQQHENAGMGGGGSGGRSRNANQTLRALTLRQIAKDIDDSDGDTKIIDGAELYNVTVVGKILSAHDSSMRVTLNISDGTGELEVTHWLQDESEPAMAAKRAELRPGVYVRVYGHVQANNSGQRGLSAFSLRPVTDFNEVTYHFLRCIFEHLHLTKGGAAGQKAGGGMGMATMNAAGNGWQQQQGHNATAYAGGSTGSACGDAVLNILRACNSDMGMHTHELYNRLNGQYNKMQVDQALQQLAAEAHVYTTTDDDHYRAA